MSRSLLRLVSSRPYLSFSSVIAAAEIHRYVQLKPPILLSRCCERFAKFDGIILLVDKGSLRIALPGTSPASDSKFYPIFVCFTCKPYVSDRHQPDPPRQPSPYKYSTNLCATPNRQIMTNYHVQPVSFCNRPTTAVCFRLEHTTRSGSTLNTSSTRTTLYPQDMQVTVCWSCYFATCKNNARMKL